MLVGELHLLQRDELPVAIGPRLLDGVALAYQLAVVVDVVLNEDLALGIGENWVDAQDIFLLYSAHLRISERSSCLRYDLDILLIDVEPCGVADLLGAL